MPSTDALLVLDAADDVAVARRVLVPGEVITVGDTKLTVRDEVTIGHKIALRDIATDTPVTKYGYQIGLARQPIKAGQHVHLHNLAFSSHTTSVAGDFGGRGGAAPPPPPPAPPLPAGAGRPRSFPSAPPSSARRAVTAVRPPATTSPCCRR